MTHHCGLTTNLFTVHVVQRKHFWFSRNSSKYMPSRCCAMSSDYLRELCQNNRPSSKGYDKLLLVDWIHFSPWGQHPSSILFIVPINPIIPVWLLSRISGFLDKQVVNPLHSPNRSANVHTVICWWFTNYNPSLYSWFSSNSEANASDLLENHEYIFPQCYIYYT